MRLISLIAVVVFASSLAAPARAGMMDDCVQERDRELQIGGCTAMIGAGQYSNKDLGTAYYNRGNAYYALGERRRAIENFDQALRINQGDTSAYYNRGLAYYDLGEYRRAIEDYDEALRLDPGKAKAYGDRGLAYYNLGEYRRAIEDYGEVLRLDPGKAKAYGDRATARCHLGMIETSLDDRMQALRLEAITAENAQRHLRDRGFYKGAIDGDFGPASRKALRDWTTAGCP